MLGYKSIHLATSRSLNISHSSEWELLPLLRSLGPIKPSLEDQNIGLAGLITIPCSRPRIKCKSISVNDVQQFQKLQLRLILIIMVDASPWIAFELDLCPFFGNLMSLDISGKCFENIVDEIAGW